MKVFYCIICSTWCFHWRTVTSLLDLFLASNRKISARNRVLTTTSSSSTTTSCSSVKKNSPWSPSEWTITLNIGRQPGVKYEDNDNDPSNGCNGNSWGVSGSRLILPIEVLIESDYYSTASMDNIKNNNKKDKDEEHFEFLGEKAFRLSILEDPMYVTMDGQQTAPFEEVGAWKIKTTSTTTTTTTNQQNSFAGSSSILGSGNIPTSTGSATSTSSSTLQLLRFWFDTITTTASSSSSSDDNNKQIIVAKNKDVTLVSSQRLYCFTNCWRINDEYYSKLQYYQQLEQTLQQYQNEIDECLCHETGDRRLDGTDPVNTIAASIDMAVLIQKRDNAYKALRSAEQVLPTTFIHQNCIPGPWPGTNVPLIIASGTVAIKRKRTKKINGILPSVFPYFGDVEYLPIGTFTAKPSDKWVEVTGAES